MGLGAQAGRLGRVQGAVHRPAQAHVSSWVCQSGAGPPGETSPLGVFRNPVHRRGDGDGMAGGGEGTPGTW